MSIEDKSMFPLILIHDFVMYSHMLATNNTNINTIIIT